MQGEDKGGGGWASRSLDDVLQHAEASGIAVWQIVMIYTVYASAVSVSRWVLAVAHLVVFAAAALIVVRRLRAWPLLIVICAVLLLDYRAALDVNSALSFANAWTSLLFAGIPFLLLPSRHAWAFSLLAVAVTDSALLSWHGSWGARMPIVTTLTAVTLMVAALVLMRTLRAFAGEADAQEVLAAREREQLQLRRTVAQTAAEDARVMHDTMINTLSAISRGSSLMTNDIALVRERCARDVAAVEARLGERRSGRHQGFQPATIAVPRSMKLCRAGLGDDEVDRYLAELPPHVSRAVQGAVQELIRNAGKHSGADRVTLDIRLRPGALVVTVADEGRGFDGRLIAGRGLAESVVARARDAGVDVAISTAPGEGTTVDLVIALDEAGTAPAELADDASAAARVVEQIRRTACWQWARIMVSFGVADVLIREPPGVIAACAMLAVVGALSWLASRPCRDGRTLPGWLTALTLLGIPVSFLTGLGSIDFGRSAVNDWPAIAITALPVVLLVTRRTMTAFFAGISLLVLTAAVTAYVVWRTTSSAAAVVAVGAATQLAILTAWLVLHQAIDDIGTQHQRALRELAVGRLERAARDRIIAARARWTNAGARTSVAIMRRIADGELDPAERDVQLECAEAERYLRQVLLLSPEVVHMSPWIGRAMTAARSKSVTLILRGCAADAPDEELAETLGRAILASIDGLAPGAELGVGLFPDERGQPLLLLVGPSGSLREIPALGSLPGAYTLTYQQLGAQDLVELTVIEHLGGSPTDHGYEQRGSHDPERASNQASVTCA